MIEMKHLSKWYGSFQVLKDCSTRVDKGEVVVVCGPSGSGKSVLLQILAGILPPTAGRVLYDGQAITGPNRRVGYMTQNDHLLPWRDVAGNIAVPLEIRRTPRAQMRQRIEELIVELCLKDYRVGRLSERDTCEVRIIENVRIFEQ